MGVTFWLCVPAGGQTLGNALNATQLTWTTGGGAPWLVQSTNSHDGALAAQSGAITNSQESWLQTTVSGPGLLSFWWSVSSFTSFDYLEFYTNGVRAVRISGAVGWQSQTFLFGTGPQTLRWRYVKETGGSRDDRGWLDEVNYSPPPTSGPPTFVLQPVSRTNKAGTAVTLNGLAGGESPLTYQWRKDGVPLAEEGNATGTLTDNLTLANVLKADQGAYALVVSNSSACVTSAVAVLTVLDPAILTHPIPIERESRQTATFTVIAGGTPPLDYQWRKAGVALSEATDSVLNLTNVQAGDAALYDVIVTGAQGSITSSPVELAINLATLDSAFNPGAEGSYAGSSSPVYALAVQPDGKILVGGSFVKLGGQARTNLGRLNADGTLDTAFNPGVVVARSPLSPFVSCLAMQSDGKILVGGLFAKLGGQWQTNLGRLNSNGTLDSTFNPRPNDRVSCLAMQADGKILVGGAFTNVAGQTRNRIARLNPNGTLDDAFNPGASGPVHCTALQPDGRILVGGSFSNLAGQTRRSIGRLNPNGTLDLGFNPDANGLVYALAVQPDEKVLAVGAFTTLGGERLDRIGRLNADGTLDETLNPMASSPVHSIAVQTDGKILVGGEFFILGGQFREGIGRLRANGTLDCTFKPEARIDFPPSGGVHALAVQSDGRILVGGGFTGLGGQSRKNIGRLNASEPATQSLSHNGSNVTWLRGGSSPEVWRTTFEVFNGGTNWTMLGDGTRIPGGWALTGLSLPANVTIRARGWTTGGRYGGSTWFVESVYAHATPWIVPGESSPQYSANGFTFEFAGSAGSTVVVEGSANLGEWLPLQTNLLGDGPLRFHDSNAANCPVGFYRVRLKP